MRHHPNPQIFIIFLERNLIMKLERPNFNNLHLLDRKVHDHSLLDPLIHLPVFTIRLSHPQLAFIKQSNHLAHGILALR